MRLDPVLVVLVLYRVTEIGRFSSVCSDDSLVYDFATDTVQGFPVEKIAPVKRHKVDDGPMVHVVGPVVDVNWLRGVACRTFSEFERDFRSYRVIVAVDARQPADDPVEVVEDLDEVFVQEALWKEDGGSSFTGDDRPVTTTALTCLSKAAPTSAPDSGKYSKR